MQLVEDEEYGDFDGEEERAERRRDTKIDEAREAILGLLEENAKAVYYIKQLQILLERRFFHWIVGFAVAELIEEGKVGAEVVALSSGAVKFIFRRRHRRRRLQIRRAVKVIKAYSEPAIARACGQQAENLFLLAFGEYGFELVERNTREYEGRRWTASAHTLDFVVRRDGLAYGAEVKNTWDYIPRDEFRVKMGMCKVLGVRPLFVWRYAPKNYMNEVFEAGGYGMIFKAHIFPMGQEGLVEAIRGTLGLECDAPRTIPDGIMERFMRWHEGGLRRGGG